MTNQLSLPSESASILLVPGDTVRELAAAGAPMFAPLNDLTDVTLVDLPTGHWPMLSRPSDLANVIAQQASRGLCGRGAMPHHTNNIRVAKLDPSLAL
jgi:hypothetical protein